MADGGRPKVRHINMPLWPMGTAIAGIPPPIACGDCQKSTTLFHLGRHLTTIN